MRKSFSVIVNEIIEALSADRAPLISFLQDGRLIRIQYRTRHMKIVITRNKTIKLHAKI